MIKEKGEFPMKKSVWRGICIACIVLSVLLAAFHVVIYGLVGAAAVMLMLLTLDPDAADLRYPTWGEFYANFVGSPLFYIDLAVAAALILSAVMWAVCKKREKCHDQ